MRMNCEKSCGLCISAELEPKAEILSDYGSILARLGSAADARAQYRKALELDPHCASAHFNLGVDAVRSGEYAKAESHYREALATKPNAETWNGLGYALAYLRKPDESMAAFRKAIELDPGYAPACTNLGDALSRQGKYAEAEEWYRRSFARKPGVAVSNNLGAVLRKLGRDAEAAAQYKATLGIDPGNAEATRNLKELAGR